MFCNLRSVFCVLSSAYRKMIQVYTGDGKGKTTAALGQALRALGHGWKVLVVQFMKGDSSYGEVIAARKLPLFKLVQFGLKTFVERGNPSAEDVRLAAEGMAYSEQAVRKSEYRMIILDEINVAIDYGLIPLAAVLKLIRGCPTGIELILTGRGAKKEVIQQADLVSEVREIKHPYMRGIVNREGVDY